MRCQYAGVVPADGNLIRGVGQLCASSMDPLPRPGDRAQAPGPDALALGLAPAGALVEPPAPETAAKTQGSSWEEEQQDGSG